MHNQKENKKETKHQALRPNADSGMSLMHTVVLAETDCLSTAKILVMTKMIVALHLLCSIAFAEVFQGNIQNSNGKSDLQENILF